jgi:hypothetical protein
MDNHFDLCWFHVEQEKIPKFQMLAAAQMAVARRDGTDYGRPRRERNARMMTRLALALLCPAIFSLCGCLPAVAAGAAGMAARGAMGRPESNAHLAPDAESACTAAAARYGSVHIIDVEQRATNKIIVWGTVGEGGARQSFECDYGTRITGFKLRPIAPSR